MTMINGDSGGDNWNATACVDTIGKREGDDSLSGWGDDFFAGGDGKDSLWGDAGNDALDGESGCDWLVAGDTLGDDAGTDTDWDLNAPDYRDVPTVDEGAQEISGNGGSDFLSDAGADTLSIPKCPVA